MTGRAKVIAFANQKGGVAKTTTTLNLAAAFVEEGHRVLCVDMDPQGNLTMSQGLDPDSLDRSMFDVLVHDLPIREVIVPVQCEYLSMRGLIQLQNTLSMIQENLNPDVDIAGILPTMVDARTLHAKEAIELLEENFGDRVFASRITKTVRFAEAPVKGMSVLKYDPDGKAAYAYRALAKEVLGDGKRR